jgi:hypothetical protein
LPRIREAGQVAEFGDDRDGDEELDAAQRLQGLDDGIQAPGGRPLEQFGLERWSRSTCSSTARTDS